MKMIPAIRIASTLALLSLPASARFPKLELQAVSEGELLAPVGIVHAGDGSGRLFVIEQRGQIRILDGESLFGTPFLDISDRLVPERPGFDERGLLGLAFHPEYATPDAAGEGRFYVYYSAPSPDAPGTTEEPVDHRSVVSEFQVSSADPDVADPASERVLFTVNQPQFNHDAGQLAFGPDGLLYIALGDGGSSDDNNAGHTGGDDSKPSGVLGNSQDLTRLLGKILRIDPLGTTGPGGAYGIPADNPFVGQGGGVREEIYAYGLRNPWRFSFDDGAGGSGRLFCADVGQGNVEEVNLIEKGGNYGWRNKEGVFDFDSSAPGTGPFVDPVAQYAHPNSDNGLPRIGLSVTGGYVYRGTAIPDLAGHYVFADWSSSFGSPSGTLLGLEEISPGEFSLVIPEVVGGNPIVGYIAALGVDETGELYVATKTTLAPSATDPGTGLPTGAIWRIVSGEEPGETVTRELTAAKDNTIFSENVTRSNGAGPGLFAGVTIQGDTRRALVEFDLADEFPPGTVVHAVTFKLQVDKVPSGAPNANMTLHRVVKEWGEAGSNAGTFGDGAGAPAQTGDATWLANRFGEDTWAVPGGDFESASSASTAVGGLGAYEWTGMGLVSDVQTFVDSPELNAGWLLHDGGSTTGSAKRFLARESGSLGPRLEVEATLPPPTNREAWIARFFDPEDVVDLTEDADGDRLEGILEYGAGLDPFTRNPVSDAYSIDFEEEEGRLTIRFRRDPRATDLIYRVDAGNDLTFGETLAVSEDGALAAGSGVVSDHPIPGAPPFREVTVRDGATPSESPRRFVRFVVISSVSE